MNCVFDSRSCNQDFSSNYRELSAKKFANAFIMLLIACLILLQHSSSQVDPAYWDRPFDKPQYMVHSTDSRNIQSWRISDAPKDWAQENWASTGIIEVLGPFNNPRQLCNCMAASGKVNMETFNIISCSLMPKNPGESKLPTDCPQIGSGTGTKTGSEPGTPAGQTEGPSNLVLVRNQVKTEVKQGNKFTLSPQDKLELKANCDRLVDLFRANMGKDRDLNAVISAAALLLMVNIRAEYAETIGAISKSIVVCGKLYSGGYDQTPSKRFESEISSELPTQSELPAQIELQLEKGSMVLEVVNDQALLKINAATMTVSSIGKNTFAVVYDPINGIGLAIAYQDPINITPKNSSLAPFVLGSGLMVAIGEDKISRNVPVSQAVANGTASGSGATAGEIGVIRTLSYHEITSQTDTIDCHNGAMPVISDYGENAAFIAHPDGRAHVYVVKTDGTQPPQDVFSVDYGYDTPVALSPDGTKVAAGAQGHLGFADVSSGRITDFSYDGGLGDFKITDSGQVYFLAWGDVKIVTDPDIHVTRGLWRVDFDGRRLTPIAAFDKIAALLGVSPDSVTPTNAGILDLSSEGSRIVFSVSSEKGKHILGINSDGTGLKEYVFPRDYMWSILDIGISGDGSKIFYIINPNPCCSTPQEVGVINFDDYDRQVLINGTGPTQDLGKLSYDGSLLLVGSGHGWLVDTRTGAKLELTALGGWDSDDRALVGDEMYLPSMNGKATKFLYLQKDKKDIWQLAIAEMNPPSLKEAPIITNPKIDPPFILSREISAANVSASIAASNTIVAVGTELLLNGLRDESGSGKMSLHSAGGGVFAGAIEGNRDASIGTRIVRLKAEVIGNDGMRHATAVDLWPFAVAESKDQATDMINTQPPTLQLLQPMVMPPASSSPPIQEEGQDDGQEEEEDGLNGTIINLTGIWSCNDGGVYYIRQIGDNIWWFGEEPAENRRWANAACGTISGRNLMIKYADVPAGTSTGYGTIEMDIVSNDELMAKDKPASYAGSQWVRVR
ncbi:MAG: hypothetical protein PHQ34_09810 [Methanothrix sp.]|nr:hypothetical protein [Methanothrix sp.]